MYQPRSTKNKTVFYRTQTMQGIFCLCFTDKISLTIFDFAGTKHDSKVLEREKKVSQPCSTLLDLSKVFFDTALPKKCAQPKKKMVFVRFEKNVLAQERLVSTVPDQKVFARSCAPNEKKIDRARTKTICSTLLDPSMPCFDRPGMKKKMLKGA